MYILATSISLCVAAIGQVAAQGFLGNCTWRGANLTGTFLGMYCEDDDHADFDYKWTWHDLDVCITNNGGQLWPYDNGGYAGSCRDCSIDVENHLAMNFSCDCFDTESNLATSILDLNRVLWNHNGALGCFEHEGNRSACGPMCEPGWVPPPFTTPLPSTARRDVQTSAVPVTLI